MKRSMAFLLAAIAAASTAPGCTGTIIREGGGVVLGAKGSYMPIQPIAADKEARPLGVYERFELGEIVDDIGGRAPADFLAHLPAAFREQIEAKKLPDRPGGKTMLVRGRIVHYETSSMLGFALGPLEEVVVRTEFVDKSSGKVLGVANCIGRTKAAVNAGAKKKAEGLAKALAGWIDARYPKEGRE
jgi:hypothetical protein